MSDDVLVRVEKVSKRFCRSLKRSLWYGLQDLSSEPASAAMAAEAGCRTRLQAQHAGA
jgi:hypothetical protein